MIARLILDNFLINIIMFMLFFFSMAMRISYQNLLQRLVVSKTSVQTVSYMKFLITIGDHYKVQSVQ